MNDRGPRGLVVGLVGDLMDRTRLAVLGDITWAGSADEAARHDPDVVIVDLARFADAVGPLRSRLPDAVVVCFGPHVDAPSLAAAVTDGADRALPRSRFFADPVAALARDGGTARA